MLNVFIGWDARESRAYRVAADSIARHASQPVAVHKLDAFELYDQRLLWRPVERVGGQSLDHLSGAPQSTAFANARFVVPFLQRSGLALFVDCDVLALGDVAELFALRDVSKAVMCVQHDYTPRAASKMDGCAQTQYRRKNWSSVMLINCDHPAHLRLSLAQLNQYPGELLHRFFWLRDSEIGALPAEWNWLVGEQPKPAAPKLAHYTLGGPWINGWTGAEHDDLWLEAEKHHAAGR